jgi:hypothetical protein
MTDPHYQPGDVANGHRLTVQPDGTMMWLPVDALPVSDPQHKPGDVANGHRLTIQPDGTTAWLPDGPATTPGSTKKRHPLSRRPVQIALVALGVLLALIIVIGTVNGKPKTLVAGDTPTSETTKVEETDEPLVEAEKEPEKVIVPDVTGMAASQAVAALRGSGFVVADPTDPDAIVISTTPSKGGITEQGSTVTLSVEPPKPKLTLAQENALEQAQSYLDFSSFSRQGLIDQMSSEFGSGYPVDVASWAVDYLNPDWNAEAVEAAESYLEFSSFSRDGLYEQLTSEYGSHFTPEQANAALAAVGY